jgi:predicted ferric reductase
MRPVLRGLTWLLVACAVIVPLALAARSPFLEYRSAIYITGGFAGIAAMALLLMQPLLVGGYLPGLDGMNGRRAHRAVGVALVLAVVTHVVALWITSPPDVIDVLTFTSPTPFSVWGNIAMWAVFAAATLAALRRRLRFNLRIWRRAHTGLAAVTVAGSVVHAVQIEGTMEPVSKVVLCILVVAATLWTIIDLRVWTPRPQ